MIRETREYYEKEITKAQQAIESARFEIKQLENNCRHDWTVQYDPFETGGYSYPGDPPGTMGVDWRPGGYVPPHSQPRWSRTCNKCGKKETTTASREVVSAREPLF